MKTAELAGALLNYWVAQAEGYETKIHWRHGELRTYTFLVSHAYPEGYPRCFDPSNDWIEGGPIIDREKISTMIEFGQGEWTAEINSEFGEHASAEFRQRGPTALVAAMRVFVASRFGDEVDDFNLPLPV